MEEIRRTFILHSILVLVSFRWFCVRPVRYEDFSMFLVLDRVEFVVPN